MELDLKEIERASEANKVGLKYHYPPLKSKVPILLLRTLWKCSAVPFSPEDT